MSFNNSYVTGAVSECRRWLIGRAGALSRPIKRSWSQLYSPQIVEPVVVSLFCPSRQGLLPSAKYTIPNQRRPCSFSIHFIAAVGQYYLLPLPSLKIATEAIQCCSQMAAGGIFGGGWQTVHPQPPPRLGQPQTPPSGQSVGSSAPTANPPPQSDSSQPGTYSIYGAGVRRQLPLSSPPRHHGISSLLLGQLECLSFRPVGEWDEN